ncbi:radical SAM protein [Fervidobacterium riparium]|nr:hypothetical protein IB67_02455 [Fervidobacterium riparium]
MQYYISENTIEFNVENCIYLINPLSGSLDKIADEQFIQEWNLVKNKKSKNYEFLKMLSDRGYIFFDVSEEEKLHKKLSNFIKQMKKPLRVHLILSYDCNLRCKYCFQNISRSKKIAKEIVIQRMFDTIEFLKLENNHEKVEIVLFGGEPLIRNKFLYQRLKQTLDTASTKNYSIEIVTNGVHLESYIPLLKNYNISQIQVTLDGPKNIHDERKPVDLLPALKCEDSLCGMLAY